MAIQTIIYGILTIMLGLVSGAMWGLSKHRALLDWLQAHTIRRWMAAMQACGYKQEDIDMVLERMGDRIMLPYIPPPEPPAKKPLDVQLHEKNIGILCSDELVEDIDLMMGICLRYADKLHIAADETDGFLFKAVADRIRDEWMQSCWHKFADGKPTVDIERYDSDGHKSIRVIFSIKKDETVFPELKESEDEIVIAALKSGINGLLKKEYLLKGLGGISFDIILAYLEKQGEQKPVEKVEPKFKVGDWVVGANNVFKIILLNDELNCYIAVTPNDEEVKIPYHFDNGQGHMCSYHLWTIQDAKDGDVLYAKGNYFKEYLFMFSSFTEDNVISTHFGYDVFHRTFDKKLTRFGREEDFMSVTPATKKQRDTLMEAMADAGYTFDFERKELKKIAVPIFNIGDSIIKKHNSDINDFGSFTITDITGGKYWYNDRNICDISEQYEWELYEPVRQNPAWNEEDETYLGLVITAIKLYYTDDKGEENPWREELLRWLNSLRPQPTWKPTLQQINALSIAVKNGHTPDINALEELLEKLKAL